MFMLRFFFRQCLCLVVGVQCARFRLLESHIEVLESYGCSALKTGLPEDHDTIMAQEMLHVWV